MENLFKRYRVSGWTRWNAFRIHPKNGSYRR